jgi:nitroimidazol reductase NimA-like FMN-containing flavoprotein (pyridoxamine 5'-phosphate oxidase superfamily)
MFPVMRRFKQEIPADEAREVLHTCSSGVLALAGANGYPYTVPLSYVFIENRLLFHGATEGYKMESLKKDNRASFCVIDRDDVVPERFATLYRSVVVFGRVNVITDDGEKKKALEAINAKYSPAFIEEGQKEIEKDWNRAVLLSFEIEQLTGKIDLQTMIERAREAREAAGETCPGKQIKE